MIEFKIIAVDFDGTLCENKWPEIGEPNHDLIDYLIREQRIGSKIILWTCRIDDLLQDAINWCTKHDLIFDEVNRNVPEVEDVYGPGGPKIHADVYIDDKACSFHNVPFVDAIKLVPKTMHNPTMNDIRHEYKLPPIPPKVKTASEEWAEREVELAFPAKHRAHDFTYGRDCCDSAMRAYTALMADNHSGMSIGMTKDILNRLIDRKPLTKIEDDTENWNLVTNEKGKKTYQSTRMASLFKDVQKDGSVYYHDIDRVYCVDAANPKNTYGSGLVTRIIHEMFPIKMPYYPNGKRFKVVCEELLTDIRHGDFDTVALLFVTTPDGDDIEINRYFKEGNDGWIEIMSTEYIARSMKAARGAGYR